MLIYICPVFLVQARLIVLYSLSSCQSELSKSNHFSLSSIFSKRVIPDYLIFFFAQKLILTLFVLILLQTITNSVSLFDMDVKTAHCSQSVMMIWLSIPFLLLSLFAFLTTSEDSFMSKVKLIGSFAIKFRVPDFKLLLCLLSI